MMPAEFRKRFWKKVRREGECWVWTGGSTFLMPHGRQNTALRAAFVIAGIPKLWGHTYRRTCDTPGCVNPAHFTIAAPDRPGQLTIDQVRAIKERLAVGDTQTQIAKDFGVPIARINHIATRRTWRYI